MSEVKTPWKDYMGDVPMHLDYFQGSMFEAVERMAELYPNNIAFDFMGKSTTYKKMVQEIEKCAKSLKTLGVRPGDKVTIAMPNCPQAIYMFYAVNLVGGIANMIHPLSAEKEIEFYLNASESTTAITLDQFYDKFEHIRQNTGIINIIIDMFTLIVLIIAFALAVVWISKQGGWKGEGCGGNCASCHQHCDTPEKKTH